MRRFIFFCLLLLTFLSKALGQCPIANTCTPGSAPTSNHIFGLGIYNVSVGTGSAGFSHATAGGSVDGFQDYSCTKQATVFDGVPTAIAITTNPNVNENVRVWVDLNNNGTFDVTSELVFSSSNAKLHTGNFTIPVTGNVVKNTVLRMRISAENFSSPLLNPCATPVYSQVEDYGIIILPNTQKPKVDFSVSNATVCTPTVQFKNLIQNGATTYLWSFGDNTTSTQPNPSHTYAAFGTYTIKLKACNANGCDSLTKTNYLTYQNTAPIAATCTPSSTSACCGYGITKVSFSGMVNTSSSGNAGYEDFSCAKSVTVAEGEIYPISIETNPGLNQDTWVYIDFNNNGAFETSELVLTKLSLKNPTGSITIPTGKVLNTPLRMRIVSDEQGSTAGPCLNSRLGQVEDYSVIITQPKVNFTSNFSSICASLIQFTATGSQPATSWRWDFGDGTSSTLQNPQHNYTNNGIYSVKLKICSASGCDSLTKANYVNINKPCPTYCLPTINSNFTSISITRVTLKDIDNISTQEPGGYGNYTRLATRLTQGSYNQLSINANNTTGLISRVLAWIDFNRDGDFQDAGEEVMFGSGISMKKNITVPVTATLGMTRMRIIAFPDTILANSCSINLTGGEIEDYSIEIKAVSERPTTYFSAKVNGCNGLSVQFSDSSTNLPATRTWTFGDAASGAANTSSLQNPVHNFSGAGTYTVKLKTCNSFGCDSLQQVITVLATTFQEPKNTCVPTNITTPKNFFGIEKVTINTINNITSGAADGYKNYACSQRTTLATLNTYQIIVHTAATLPSNQPSFNPYRENVKVWIDYDYDGTFSGGNELILNSTSRTTHTATFIPPNNAAKNKPLRMRVANIFQTGRTPSNIQHCILPDSGEVEDYTVTIVPFNNVPTSAFTQNSKTACGNAIQFTDTSAFLPTNWLWSFGDTASGAANTSTLRNPSHMFSAPGTYTITLTTCNSNGCNTLTKTNYITVVPSIGLIPAPVTCKPQTLNYCCNKGIRSVYFAKGAINHVTGNAAEGYQDFSCTQNVVVNFSESQLLGVGVFNQTDIVKAWIDYDNNSFFDNSELIFNGNGYTGNVVFNFPPNVVKGVYLRMRVISDDPAFPIQGGCNNVKQGQAEDYAVKIIDSPITQFSYDGTVNCSGNLTFTDNSTRTPTSWTWTFGDPVSGASDTSHIQNPAHLFSSSGNYNVSLTACNSHGCNTISKNIYVGINNSIALAPSCQPTTLIKSPGFGILNVNLDNINNTTTGSGPDYKNYACSSSTNLIAGNTYPLTVSVTRTQAQTVQVWIDFDNDGVFTNAEKVLNSLSAVGLGRHFGNIIIPQSAVNNVYLRMRVMSESFSSTVPGPCGVRNEGETEDYAVLITDPLGLSINNLTNRIKLYPNPNNGAFTLELPEALKGNYQLEVQDLIGKTVAKKPLKVQSSAPQQVELSHLPKGVYFLKLSNEKASAVKKIVIE